MIKSFAPPQFEQKILSTQQLVKIIAEYNNAQWVFTNGCFDLIHRGHVSYLAQAKTLGDYLIVALNSDHSIKTLAKGVNRPINSLADRMAVVAALESVSFVTYFEKDTPLELIKLLKPQILVKGGDWQMANIVGADQVIATGGAVYAIPFIHQNSTTKIINRCKDQSVI